MTTWQAHHERVLKVLDEEGETPPNWLGHILLCRCNSTLALSLLQQLNQTDIHTYFLCRRTRDFSYHLTKVLEYKAGRDKAKAEILAGKPTLLFLSVAFSPISLTDSCDAKTREFSSPALSNRTRQPVWCLKGRASCVA